MCSMVCKELFNCLIEFNYCNVFRHVFDMFAGESQVSIYRQYRISQPAVGRILRMEQGVHHIPPPRELPGTDVQTPYVIVSDRAFPLTEHLQRPYSRRNMEEQEMVFNYRLSRARRVASARTRLA